jgi:hypothetical protein
MSGTAAGGKRKAGSLDEDELYDEKGERVDNHIIIVSNFGDYRPQEAEPDAVTEFFRQEGMSVTDYVVVPGVGVDPKFVANYRELYDKNDDGTPHAKINQLRIRYVKKMIPSTTYLENVACDVMILFCHGCPKTEAPARPHYLSFHENQGVSVRGYKVGSASPATIIWSCSSYTESNANGKPVQYAKCDGGVTLSDVVEGSKLVLLLSCCGDQITREYGREAGGPKPDFVVFRMPDRIHDVTHNIFLALLMHCIENWRWKEVNFDQIIRRQVCRVLILIKVHGNAEDGRDADKFWKFLHREGMITTGINPGASIERQFRVKGSILTIEARRVNPTTGRDDKDLYLEELKTLTLQIWNGTEYYNIDTGTKTADLIAWKEDKQFKKSSQLASEASAAKPTTQSCSIQIDTLLSQLRGLAHGV